MSYLEQPTLSVTSVKLIAVSLWDASIGRIIGLLARIVSPDTVDEDE